MSKLKPIKDDAELARVPIEEPVLVELEPVASGEDRAAAANEPDDDEPAGGDDTGGEDIAAQLKAANEATARERQAREAAETRAREAAEEADRLRSTGADNEKALLTGSLERAQQDQAAAKAVYKQAYEAGDPDAMADAQAKLARSAAEILHYEGAVANFSDVTKTQTKDAPVDIITAIDRDPKLLPPERDWLKQHPETLTDPALNAELTVAHNRAIRAGHARGTDGYFKVVEDFMGFGKSKGRTDNNREREPSVSAPVSRDGRSFGGQPLKPTQVALTPEERSMARSLGQSETTYARNKQLLERRKQSDPERYATRG